MKHDFSFSTRVPRFCFGSSTFALLLLATIGLAQTEIRYQKGLACACANQRDVAGSRAEACAPATALRDLEWNNVRALIENGGALWYNRAIDRGAHFVPKEEGVSVVYGGALWLGGISPDQQLKLAAVRYRTTGNDFWPGPLTNDGSAETDPNTCDSYDRFAVSFRADAQRHRQYHEAVIAETVDTDFPDGYAYPSYLTNTQPMAIQV